MTRSLQKSANTSVCWTHEWLFARLLLPRSWLAGHKIKVKFNSLRDRMSHGPSKKSLVLAPNSF